MSLQTKFINLEIPYTGKELSPHYLLREHGVKGSSIVSFIGGCSVETDSLVDYEDRLSSDSIRAKKMVHFLGEFFGPTLRETVLLQRLFISRMAQSVVESWQLEGGKSPKLSVKGDDIYVERNNALQKLNVSIATSSPVSQLLHVGVNVDASGAPVPAIGLSDLGIDAVSFSKRMLQVFSDEWDSIDWACAKVRPVL